MDTGRRRFLCYFGVLYVKLALVFAFYCNQLLIYTCVILSTAHEKLEVCIISIYTLL